MLYFTITKLVNIEGMRKENSNRKNKNCHKKLKITNSCLQHYYATDIANSEANLFSFASTDNFITIFSFSFINIAVLFFVPFHFFTFVIFYASDANKY